jgi:hypothetical protein
MRVTLDVAIGVLQTIRWKISSMARGDSFAPRSSHQRKSDNRPPAIAWEQAVNSCWWGLRRSVDSLIDTLLDPPREVALSKLEECFDPARVDQGAI